MCDRPCEDVEAAGDRPAYAGIPADTGLSVGWPSRPVQPNKVWTIVRTEVVFSKHCMFSRVTGFRCMAWFPEFVHLVLLAKFFPRDVRRTGRGTRSPAVTLGELCGHEWRRRSIKEVFVGRAGAGIRRGDSAERRPDEGGSPAVIQGRFEIVGLVGQVQQHVSQIRPRLQAVRVAPAWIENTMAGQDSGLFVPQKKPAPRPMACALSACIEYPHRRVAGPSPPTEAFQKMPLPGQ